MLLASAAERAVPDLRALDLVGMVREFRATLGRETDFLLEAHTIQRFRAALARVEGVWIPDVVAQFSSRAVLTMEHSPGIRVDEYAASHPESRIKLAGSIAALVLNQVLDTGLFHADPHPGNVFVLGDGRICLHDFGMVGDLDAPLREALFETLDAVVRGDSRMLAAAYLELGLVGEDVDRSRLHDELAELLRQIRARPIQDVSVGDALVALLRVGSRHRVRNPAQVLLLARALLISEALMRTLDPDIDIIAVFRKEIERALKRRHSPSHLRDRGLRLALDLERVLEDAPHDLRLGLRRIGDGELGRVHAPKLEALGARASRGIERLTGAVAAAALIIAGALLATIGGWHRVVGDVLLVAGTAGTLLVALGALWKRDE
jgi:ubiquinone biosynthesis protein